MESMRLRNCKQALCSHFGVATSRELRKNQVWLEFAEENRLPALHGCDAWKQAYEAVFDLPQTEDSETQVPDLEGVVNQGLKSFQAFTESVWPSKQVTQAVDNLQGGVTDVGDAVEDAIADGLTNIQDFTDNALGAMFSVLQSPMKTGSWPQLKTAR